MATEKRNIQLSFSSEGLDKIQNQISVFSAPISLSINDKENKKLLKERESIQKEIEKISKEGATPEQIEQLAKKTEDFIKKATQELVKGLTGAASNFGQSILDGLKKVAEAQKELESVQKEKKGFERRFDTGPEGDIAVPKSQVAKEDLVETGIAKLKEEGKLQEDLVRIDSKRLTSAKSLLSIKNDVSEKLGKDGEKELENFAKTGVASKKLLQTLEELRANGQTRLSDEQILGRLKVLNAAEEAGTQEKINQFKKLENKETDAQAKLQVESNVLLKEKTDLLEEAKKYATPEESKQIEQVGKAIDTTVKAAKSKLDVDEDLDETQKDLSKSTENLTRAIKNKGNTLSKAAKQVFNYGVAFSILRRIYRETLRTITQLDKALTEMAIVTTMNRKEAWNLAGSMQQLAKETGFTATEIAKINTLFLRQGRSVSEAANLTRVAAQAARIASISGAESANFLTSAVNGFGLAASEVLAVSDRFAAIAANSASSYEELANGLSKFAAQANVAGVSMDFAMGLLAKGIETTREAPETIGTALKTVLARMRELTDFGKTLEDGMDISRVEGALRQVGIALRTPTGQFRDMQDVLTDIGQSWSNFNREQQASIAVSLAGTRQQSRLIAIMQDFDRTLELVNISQSAAGATNAQHTEFMRGLEAATAQMQNAYQQFITTITDTEVIIDIVKLLSEGIEFVTYQFSRLTDSGFNLTKAVVFAYGALQILNTVMKLSNFLVNKSAFAFLFNIKARILEMVATGKQIIAQKAATKVMLFDAAAKKAHMAATIAATGATKAFTVALMKNPVTLVLVAIAAAITAIVIAVSKWRKQTEDLDDSLTKTLNEIKAQNFEITRNIKNVNDLSDSIKELNKLPFLTSEQESQLEDLSSRLTDIISSDNFILINGVIDLNIDENQRIIDDFLREEQSRLSGGRRQVIATLRANVVETREVEVGQVQGSAITTEPQTITQTFVRQLTSVERGAVISSILGEFNDIFEDQGLTSDAQLVYANFFSSVLDSDPNIIRDLLTGETTLTNFVRNMASETIIAINDFTKELNESGSSLAEQTATFARLMSESEFDEEITSQLRRAFGALAFAAEQELNFEALESLGITTAQQIQEAYQVLGEDFQEILLGIKEQSTEIARLEGISEGAALDLAFARAARSADNAAESAYLYGIAFRQTNLEVAQQLDRIGSRIENLDRLRTGFREGTLSAEELFNMISSNVGLFDSESDVVRFLRGESMADDVFVERAEQEAEALVRIANAVEILNDANSTQIEKNQALQDIAFYGAITRHTGDLSNLTQEQQRYNASLARYELIAGLGIDATDALNSVINDQTIAMNQSANRTINALDRIEQRFQDTAGRVGITLADGEEAFDFNNFFEVLDGVVVPKFESLNGLTSTALDFVQDIMSEYQEELNSSFQEFKELRDRDLARQKENFNKQKKVYQDYFSAIDRLEKQRERKVERQDLVTQLSRLEGATDERSRQRALELRRELNQIDEETTKDTQTQAREALLAGFDERYAQLEKDWATAAQEFIAEMSQGGSASGNAFITTVQDANLLGDVELVDVEGLGLKLQTFTNSLVDLFGKEGTLADLFNSLPDKFFSLVTTTPEPDPIIPPITNRRRHGGGINPDMIFGGGPGMAFAGYSKGGMVNHEGLAMLHGSKSSPEAVLNPAQTAMFVGLRNALEQLNFDSNNSGGSINIEKIAISTGSMNSNQDFKRAGETLAESFKNAIQRKGITLNTNKI